MARASFIGTLAALSTGLASPSAAEPACPDPAYTAAERKGAPRAKTLTRFSLAGADLAVVATGRLAFMDTGKRRHDLEEAVDMSKVMPGYPQPAYVTFDLKLSF